MNKVLEKVLPQSFTLNTADKPMHSGEIFYLWESLTAGYQIINIAETYQMNTKDNQLHLLLKGITSGMYLTRIGKLEKLLKDAGFTVPPRPAAKTLQGKPGMGQEVRLSDEEVIKVIYILSDVILGLDSKAIGSVTTNEKIRDVFIELLNTDMLGFDVIQKFANSRQAIDYPPPATAGSNGLNMGEIYWLWYEIEYRYASIIMLETFISNTNDESLKTELKYGLNKVAYPQIEQLEKVLKTEGFTVPARPVERMNQQPEGKVGQIVSSDSEIVSLTITAAQAAIDRHVKAYTAMKRNDVKKLIESFISMEIDDLKRMVKLSKKRNILEEPPRVTSRQA